MSSSAAADKRVRKVHCLLHDGADAELRALWVKYDVKPTSYDWAHCTCQYYLRGRDVAVGDVLNVLGTPLAVRELEAYSFDRVRRVVLECVPDEQCHGWRIARDHGRRGITLDPDGMYYLA